MNCSCSCSILQTHKDVVTEIALHLSVQTLFRCRVVCKLWRDVIDSPSFRKLHISFNKDEKEEDEKVYLQLNYDKSDSKVSTKIIDNKGKSLNLNLDGSPSPNVVQGEAIVRFSRPVEGLICLNFNLEPMVICNPFLGQFKALPLSPILASHILFRKVAIGCDGEEFYKVVELVYCHIHRRLHANLYSRRSDSWRELGDFDQELCFDGAIDSLCNDGHFAHWCAWAPSGWAILTFDMKNEVFRTIRMPDYGTILSGAKLRHIVAKDRGCSFIMFLLQRNELVRIYESSVCEEEGIRKLSWNLVANLEQELPTVTPPSWRSDYVMLKIVDANKETNVLFYDYGTRRFIGCFHLPAACRELFDYKGTFIAP